MNKIGKPAKRRAKAWPLQDAKARFSELVDTALSEGPQIVSRRGVETVVVVPVATWRQLSEPRPSLRDLLHDPARPQDDDFVRSLGRLRRTKHRHRAPPAVG